MRDIAKERINFLIWENILQEDQDNFTPEFREEIYRNIDLFEKIILEDRELDERVLK